MKIPQLTLSLGFLTFGLLNGLQAEGVSFQLKFEPEKSYHTETEVVQSSEMMLGGQKINSSADMKIKTVQKATAVEGGIEVKQTMDSIKMKMNAGGMEMDFDSENPQGMLAGMFAPMMEAKTTTLYSEKGEILKVEVPAIPGMENLGMGKEELEQSAREVADMMPNKVVAVGESWTSQSQLPLGGMTEKPVAISYTMNFAEMVEKEGNQVAKVEIKGKIEDGDENLQVTSKKIEGVMYFDPELSQPRELVLTMELEIGLPEGVAVAEGDAGKMPMKMTSTSRLIEVK